MSGEFTVVQFFPAGDYEYVLRDVSAKEAFGGFQSLITSIGALLGTTARVIITDGGDSTNAEWVFGKGITFPTPEDILAMKRNVQDQQTGG